MSVSALATILVGSLHDGTTTPIIAVVTGATLVATAIMVRTLRHADAGA